MDIQGIGCFSQTFEILYFIEIYIQFHWIQVGIKENDTFKIFFTVYVVIKKN